MAIGRVLGRVVGECGCGRHGCLSSSGDLKVVASWQQDPQGAAYRRPLSALSSLQLFQLCR